jgi:hypothetical protein
MSFIEQVLVDPRGWKGYGYEMRRTSDPVEANIFVALVGDATIEKEFGATFKGFNVCKLTSPAIVALNRDNWNTPPATFAAGDPDRVAMYRAYAVNHEVGHALGLEKHAAPRTGEPCDVMVQQTRGTAPHGMCSANPWPTAQSRPVDPDAFKTLPAAEGTLGAVQKMIQRDAARLRGGGTAAAAERVEPDIERVERSRRIRVPIWTDPGSRVPTQMVRAQSDLLMRMLRDRYRQMYPERVPESKHEQLERLLAEARLRAAS